MLAGTISIQKRCFSFWTVERNDPSFVATVTSERGHGRTLAETIMRFRHAEGPFKKQ
jgi:hypothetical protein